MKSQDPRKPPPIVIHSLAAISVLNICMAPNMSTHSDRDMTNETELATAETNINRMS